MGNIDNPKALRMAKCPMCGGHNVNNYKSKDKTHWGSKCYDKECGYKVEDESFTDRKYARYCWNINYERATGEQLPDNMCGRDKGQINRRDKRELFGRARKELLGEEDE